MHYWRGERVRSISDFCCCCRDRRKFNKRNFELQLCVCVVFVCGVCVWCVQVVGWCVVCGVRAWVRVGGCKLTWDVHVHISRTSSSNANAVNLFRII
jgi:hypothetical protein